MHSHQPCEDLSVGLTPRVSPESIAAVARHAEAAGMRSIWFSHAEDVADFSPLRAAAAATSVLRVGVGVVPLSHTTTDQILAAADGLPVERLTIGIGLGNPLSPSRALEDAADAATAIRDRLGCEVALGSLHPRSVRLAAEVADTLLLSMVSPELTGQRRGWAAAAAEAAGAAMPRVAGYVRVGIGEDAPEQLRREVAAFLALPAFASLMGTPDPREFGVAAAGPGEVPDGLARWNLLDETIVRPLGPDPVAVATAVIDVIAS